MKRRLLNGLYNLDRAVASVFGAPPQETISSEAYRQRDKKTWAKWLNWALNKIQRDHGLNAECHADKLDAVDDGREQ